MRLLYNATVYEYISIFIRYTEPMFPLTFIIFVVSSYPGIQVIHQHFDVAVLWVSRTLKLNVKYFAYWSVTLDL